MAASQNKIKLYNYARSSCSWRVRIALAYKGIPYEYKAVNLVQGEQFNEDFRKLNAFSMVPVLEDNGFVVADSFAILEYLEEKYPEPPLFPAGIKKKALIRQHRVEALAGAGERKKWVEHFIEGGFKGLESLLTAEAGKYCFGEEFTMADLVLVPQLGNAVRYQVDITKFPLLKRIGEAVSALPWVKEASPENQPDF